MKPTARYLDLVRQGRERFLKDAAPAALLRSGGALESHDSVDDTVLVGVQNALEAAAQKTASADIDILPIAKKPGAPFSDMITLGRTPNNDIILNDVTISRFHAYFRSEDDKWFVCDAGSKNGTKLNGNALAARKEMPITSGARVIFGDIDATFFLAADLFDHLSKLASNS